MAEYNIEIADTAMERNVVIGGSVEKIHIGSDVEMIPLTPNLIGKKGKVKVSNEEFVPTKHSLLTQLYDEDNFRCVYRVFVFMLLVIMYKSVLDEKLSGREVTFCMKYLTKSFYDFHNVITCCVIMFILTILLYFGYSVWAASRQSMINHDSRVQSTGNNNGTRGAAKLWNLFWLMALVTYVILMLIIPFSATNGYPTMINQFIILVTQIVLMMKSYGFLRSNVGDALFYKPHSDMNISVPTARKFIYFLLAPTLVYKNKYARSERINVLTVVSLIIELILVLIWINYLLCRVEDKYVYFGMQMITLNGLVVNVLETILIAPCLYFSIFYAGLHLFTNILGEMLRFSDRHFYEDWWSSTNIKNFCRSWNTILYEYIDTYVCKDVEKLLRAGETISSVTLIIFMSLIYEYLFCFTIGIFLPVSFLLCFLSIPSLFINYNWSILNYLFLYVFIFGSGLQLGFSASEYFARLNCPFDEETIWDFLTIRSLHCNGISS